MTRAEVFRKAAEIVSRRWGQGDFVVHSRAKKGPGYCALGALGLAEIGMACAANFPSGFRPPTLAWLSSEPGLPRESFVKFAIDGGIKKPRGTLGDDLVRFNDDEETRKEDVEMLLLFLAEEAQTEALEARVFDDIHEQLKDIRDVEMQPMTEGVR